MKEMKRILALVLCFVMLVGMMPAVALNADAAETVIDAAIFCSDVHDSTSAVSSVFGKIGESGVTYSTATFCGDTFTDKAGSSADVTNVAQTALGNASLQGYYAWGDHDDASDIADDSGLVYSGNYYIYVLSMADMDNDYSAEEAAAEMAEFTATVAELDHTKPMFIASHQPLHARRSDNVRAAEWTEVINAAGEKMDIVFFWGHNHTGDGTVDQAVYYVEKGNTLNVETTSANSQSGAGTSSSSTGKDMTIKFTYMNAGYIGKDAGRGGIATTVQITADSLIFQDYNSSGAYTDTHAHNVTVPRAFAAQETTPTVNTVTDTEDTTQDIVTAVGPGLTGVTLTVNETADTSAFRDCVAYDVALEGYIDGETVTLTFDIGNMDSTDLVVYADGQQITPVSVEDNTEDDFYSVLVTVETTSATDTYIIGKLRAAEDAVLTGIAVTTEPNVKNYTLVIDEKADGNIYLDITGLVITATYEDGTSFPVEWNQFDATRDGYALEFDISTAGTKTVTVTYGDFETSFDVTVYEHNAVDADVTEAVADVLQEGYIAKEFDPTGYTEGTAIRVIMPAPEGANVVYHVANDGTLTEVENVTFHGGYAIFDTDHFSAYVVGETTVDVEDPKTATGSGDVTTTTPKTVYVLTSSISSGNDYLIVNGNAAGSYYALANNSGSVAATPVTVVVDDNGTYIELTDATDELWTVAGSYTFACEDGYLYRASTQNTSTYVPRIDDSATTWSYNTSNHRLSYTRDNRTYYLRYNNGWYVTTDSNSATSIYFYIEDEIEVETTTTVSGTYSIAGEDVTAVAVEGAEVLLTPILTFTPADGGAATTTEVPEGAAYEVVSDENDIIEGQIEQGVVILTGNYGEALVKISYESTFGTVTNYITVTATEPYYTIDLHKAVLTEATGVTADNFASGTYYTFNETTNTYQVATAYVEGTTYYTTPVIKGAEITAPIALKGIEAGDVYGVWAVIKVYDGVLDDDGEDGADLGDVEDNRIYWSVSNETIAEIDPATGVLTFTGTNYGTFTVTASYLDEEGKILCSDTITISAEDSLYVVPGDGTNDFPEYPNEGAVRFDKTATAVGNFSETGIAKVELSMTGVPFTTDNAMDVVVMLDMTGSMSDDGMEAAEEATKAFVEKIVKNEDGTYNDNRVAVYAFNSGSSSPYELVSLGTISSDAELETANTAIDTASNKQASGGTPFDEAAATCQEVLEEAKTTNLPEGVESAEDYNRQQFCVFMSDGGPTSYEGSDGYTYYAGNNTSGDRALTSYIGGYTSSSSSSWTYNLPTEYYTDAMKADGVTIYTVGLLLQNAPSNPAPYSSMTDSTMNDDGTAITTMGSHYYFTSTILKNMASDSGKYIDIFDVDNADEATAKFTAIAQSILEAAKDVEVVDEIGNNYTVNFSIPGYGTDNAVSTDALDGTTEFYIQAVEYQLNADKERTGDPTVLENFTFNANGTLKSHTVDGVACTTCTSDDPNHVVFDANGNVTAINGTYFSYTAQTATDENGETYTKEFLNWQADKLSTTELALQYFAYLDNSTGVAEADQIPAGTYYTNEEATLTYTNYQGNRVQQEFPIPQMTWNGAQVSYVFYLVNAAGQPVNRAGRVVPFAEAVYVTDVYTYSVVWNDLEQSAGLEAKYLAEKLVPEVYALYDDTASYQIHVYEDENEVNLNNHFVIGGNVNDEYNTVTNSWTNPKTTYVFNNKSDATKYNTVGAYIANDGNDSSNSTSYYCKSAAIVGATFTSETDVGGNTVYTVTGLGNGYQTVSGETQVLASTLPSTTGATIIDGYAYYVDENNQVYTIVEKTNGAEVHQGFDFHNTTVAFAVVWKPELAPDTVVVDYGLDVVIDVITNDNMAAGVVGVRTDAPANITINSGNYTAAEAQSVDLYINANHDGDGLKEQKIGTAAVESLTSVRFSLDKDNGMLFSDPAEFYYEADVNYYNNEGVIQTTSMYSSVTVIPATTIYYEDEFVDLKTYVKQDNDEYEATDGWDVDSITASATQAQDRPGESKISADLDADNNYGYDAAYSAMSTYSMNRAAMVNVKEGKYATAEFTFYGTGFDVISMTSNTTGTLTVKIVDANGESVKNMVVDTYYGYTRNEDGEWVATPDTANALYQVPVIKAEGLTYGKYTVTITASYVKLFDHTTPAGYDLYLDAIRIYDPTGNENEVANEAYEKDGEGWPTYQELRNNIIAASNYTVTENEDGTVTVSGANLSGAIFIDGNAQNYSIADYVSYGPNNELYLANEQAIAFKVTDSNIADIQLGIKVASGGSVTYEINGDSYTVNTATDMYYSILDYAKNSQVVTIENVSGGILSLTNIKVTHTEAPAEESGISLLSMDAESAGVALMMLRRAPAIEEEIPETTEPETTEPETTEPETTEPETTEPETTEPETTEPETTEPETTEPETTEPETTEPETTEPEVTEPEETPTVSQVVKEIVKGIVNVLGKLFSRWF